MRLRVTYARRDDLRRDLDTQLSRSGIFVMVPPPDGLLYGAKLPLELVAPDGTRVAVEGEVLAAVPDQGVALTVPAAAVQTLRDALARCAADASDAPPKHERADLTAAAPAPAPASAPAAPEAPRATPADPLANWDALSPADKMRLAQYGSRDERAAVLRDRNRSLHPFVLKNPRIAIEEVVAIAKNPQMAPDLLKLIAERSEWAGRSMVADALARNPKTPNDVGVRCLQACSPESLRQMAKGIGAPPHIVQAARKLVLGSG